MPVWLVFALGGAVWLVTLGLFVKLFRRTFGFDDAQLPLFVFMAGSPFFLKNFMHTLGHFDIYGCAFAIVLLLVPARSVAFVLLAALFSMILILIHHIHLLMYVPTIAVIVVLRYYLVQGVTAPNVVVGIAALAVVGALFLAAQFWGTMPVPEDGIRPLSAKPDGRSVADRSAEFQPTSGTSRCRRNPRHLGAHAVNILGVPVFALLIWLHAPLWRYFAELIRALADESHRRIVIAAHRRA